MSKTKRYLFYSKQSDDVDLNQPLNKSILSKEERRILKDRVKSKLRKVASSSISFPDK